MKRTIQGTLAVLLVFAMLCPLTALAGQAVPIAPAPEPDDKYDDFDDWDDWDDPYWYGDEAIWEYWGFDSADEFAEWYVERWIGDNAEDFIRWAEYGAYIDISEEEYQALEEAWAKAQENIKKLRMEKLEELGGTPGIINIRYNSDFIKFTGAVPEIKDGTTFAPAKPFFEALGAKVAFDNAAKELTAEFDGWSVSLVMGQDTMNVTSTGTEDGEESDRDEEFFIYDEPYIKNGASYLPVGAVAKALGIDVYWDNIYKTVVLINRSEVIAGIDKDFSIMNRLLGMSLSTDAQDGVYKTVIGMMLSITQFDSLDGDTTLEAEADITIISDGKNFSFKGAADLSGIIDLYIADLEKYAEYYDKEELEEMIAQYNMLRKITAELIFNYDEDTLYIKAPALSGFIPELPANTWISVGNVGQYLWLLGLDEAMEGLSVGAAAGGTSMGEIIYSEFSYFSYEWYRNQIFIYENIIDSAGYNKALIGDDKFVKAGDGYRLSISLKDMTEAAEEFGEYLYMSMFDLDITIKTDGDVITGCTGGVVWREGYYYITQYKCEFDVSPAGVYVYYEVHEKNEMVVCVEINMTTGESDQPVPAGPPAGDKVIAIEELLPEDIWGFDPGGPVMPLAGAAA